jgi:hypothetical protein
MDYPGKKNTAQYTAEVKFITKISKQLEFSALRRILAVIFIISWLYLSHLSGGLFMQEACISGVIVCLLMMFKSTQ